MAEDLPFSRLLERHRTRAFARVAHRVPSSPRCAICGAPYAGIIAAAGGEAVPGAWCDQLAVGGRLVAPMARVSGQQVLLVIDRMAQGFQESVLEAVHFVPLKSGIA